MNKRITTRIGKYRENSKLASTYLHEDISWLGRCYYALNPHATDTGRLASKASQFWCGLQIQNVPVDEGDVEYAPVKQCFVADDDFFIGEADYSKNETWGTAFITGDAALLAAVSDVTRDFHGHNASKFFGLLYEEIVKSTLEGLEWVHKTINSAIRNLSKRTNHGANYNMGAQVLLDTMGIENVIKAKKLLNLPSQWSLLKVTTYLLEQFDKTYPIVRGQYHDYIKSQVSGTGFLIGPTGWTRRCFGKPQVAKRDLNAYVAHPPQSLGAMLLNKAFNRIFREVWLPNPTNFRMNAQIHDSVLFQYRKGHEHLAWQVADCMAAETPVTDIFGKTRIMRVPVDLKGRAERWSEIKALKKIA
jgi:DNA polymerase I-like protein with 3'-5' exonuclease and polymerase domains